MDLEPIHITYRGPVEAEITVERANLVAGVRRTRLQQLAEKAVEGQNLDLDEWIARTVLWPDVMACTKGRVRLADGSELAWPLDADVFALLPDDLALEIVDAVYRINPHWSAGEVAPSAEKKSASTS